MAPDDSKREDSDDPVAELLPEDPPEAEAELLPDDPSEGLAPDPPRVPDTATNDASPELKKQFWSLVLIFNVALFGMSFGVMILGFQGRWKVGGAIFAVGAFAFARGWRRYRKVTSDSGGPDEEVGGEDADETPDKTTPDDESTVDDETPADESADADEELQKD
ncbi:DUF7322 domain-containing protein [Halorussus salinisoli]|uniref:DUF7322 domain-containing protein n=1 Tax=Halorussus salinisoli TaxID=2558242 RepID=UPI0010C1C01E|nr:hypothetical protein [Halorussus salinisoli]